MAIASDNKFPKVIITEGTAPSSPSAGDQKLFIDSSDHHLKRKNSGGTVTDIEAGGGGGGGVSTPEILDRVSGGASLTLGSTHPSGTRFVLGFNGSSAGITSIAQTNVTWTQVITHTRSGGATYQIWVGVATGVSGTGVVITTGSAFTSACVAAIADALTPTLGANVAADKVTNYGDFGVSGAVAGSLVALMAGNDNTGTNNWMVPMIPCSIVDNNPDGAGTGHGLSLLLGYAPAGDVWFSLGLNSQPGVGIIAEIT